MFQIGDKIGNYEILAHLKAGGMATLFLAQRHRPGEQKRLVAIKAVHPHLSEDSEMVRMFLDEARLAARIEHPNVVRVEALAEAYGTQFLVMEYVHGCSLAQLMNRLYRRRRRMSPDLAVYIAMHVAEGLHAAHETRGEDGRPLGVVHRDVSPQNILLSHEGHIKLIDFGIAKASGRMQRTRARKIKGKLRYMAPEQARGEPVDRRTDVYALGIVIWEMLTMRPLFWEENDFELLAMVRDPHIEPPGRHVARIPRALDEAVLASLSTDKNLRPPTALDLRDQLSRAVPLAEALDSEQIAELLSFVLGDEMDRAAADLPEEASMAFGLESMGDISITRDVPSRVPTRPTARAGGTVLESLTARHVQDDDFDERRFPEEEDSRDEDSGEGPTVRAPPPLLARASPGQVLASLPSARSQRGGDGLLKDLRSLGLHHEEDGATERMPAEALAAIGLAPPHVPHIPPPPRLPIEAPVRTRRYARQREEETYRARDDIDRTTWRPPKTDPRDPWRNHWYFLWAGVFLAIAVGALLGTVLR